MRPVGLLRGVVDIDEHRTHERRLRTREVISAIGVEHRAVVLDLEEEVIDHAARQFDASGAQQAANDEVAVPAVHFVEASAGHNVFVREIKQAVRLDLRGVDLAQAMNLDRQMFDAHVAVGRQFVNGCRLGDLRRQIQHGRHLDFGIDDAHAFGHGASQRVPGRGDVGRESA